MKEKRDQDSKPKRAKRVKAPKAPRNPNVGYITHKKDGTVATGETIEPFSYQTGNSIEEIDQPRPALRPGRRISRYGNEYYELRKNRSDINPMEGL
jgi:hypothetical protein